MNDMHRILMCVMLIAATSTTSARKFPMTVGGGGMLSGDFSSMYLKSASGKLLYSHRNLTAGGYQSFEAFTCEVGLAFWSGTSTIRTVDIRYGAPDGASTDLSETNGAQPNKTNNEWNGYTSGVDLNLSYGRYPFRLNDRINFFPQVGFCYRIVSSMGNNAMFKSKEFNTLSFKQGGGFDLAITYGLLLRVEALFVLRLDNDYEKRIKKQSGDNKPSVGYGPEIKIGVRYRFDK